MNKGLSFCAVLFSGLLLSSCSLNTPTPMVNYHLLDHKNTNLGQLLPPAKVALSAVKLTDLLLQPNLVMRRDNNQLMLANYHHWAEPLDKAIQRILIANLNQHRPEQGVVSRCVGCDQLRVHIEHFYPNEQGSVVLSGYFSIEQATELKQVEYFTFSSQQTKAGYAGSVEVMRLLLDELSEKIAPALAH